jgi:hypothetical protein
MEDIIGLKNLLKEAHERVMNEFGNRPFSDLHVRPLQPADESCR